MLMKNKSLITYIIFWLLELNTVKTDVIEEKRSN